MSHACPERHGDIGAYIVGALDLGTRADVRQHLAACTACRTEYEDLLPVRDWLSRLRLTPVLPRNDPRLN